MRKPTEILRDNLAYLVDEQKRVSRAQLSAAMGISTQNLGMLIRGRNNDISGSALIRGAQFLGYSVEELVFKRMRDLSAMGVAESVPNYTQNATPIPLFDVGGSMGLGILPSDHVDIIANISVDVSQLKRKVHFTSAANLRFISGYGDSMADTFADGDTLLVDTGIFEVKVDAVYVLELGNELYIKRLQRRPDGSVLMISDNKQYEPYLIKPEEMDRFRVRGRVLMAWNVRRL